MESLSAAFPYKGVNLMSKQDTSAALLNVLDYEAAAEQVMNPAWHAYYAGGVCDNQTLRANRLAFNDLQLLPRMLRDVSSIETKTSILGREHTWPFLIAPTAMHKLAHPDGEIGSASAAQFHGLTQILSSISTTSIEDVAAVGHPVWFQLYVLKDRA